MNPVPLGHVAGRDGAERDGNDLAVQQADHAAQRADPGEFTALAPTHGFWPGKFRQSGAQRTGDQFAGCNWRLGAAQPEIAAFGHQLFAFGLIFTQKPGQGGFRRGVTRAAGFHRTAGLRRRDFRRQRNTPRAVKQPDRLRVQLRQHGTGHAPQFFGGIALHARRDFLGE